MTRRLAALLDRQAADLDSLDDRRARALLDVFDQARRELREQLEATKLPASQQALRVALAQAEGGVQGLQARLGLKLAESEFEAGQMALAHLLDVAEMQEADFRDHGPTIETQTLARLASERDLALWKYSLKRYGADLVGDIHRELVVGVAKGETVAQIANRIAGASQSVFAGRRGRAELIARMELARAYDTGHQAAVEELAATDPPAYQDPVLKKADEYRDDRNHPISPLLDGQAVLPRQEWEIPVAGDAAKGLVWPVTNGIAHGMGYPAHFHDRGRQVAWRHSWGGTDDAWAGWTSFREKTAPKAALSAPEKATAEQRRQLELAGWLDSSGRPTRAGERQMWPDRLQPSLVPDLDRRATGKHDDQGRPPDHPAVAAELEVADVFARMGFQTKHIPTKKGVSTPDYHVEGVPVDVYRPEKDNPFTVTRMLLRKVQKQASIIVVWADDHLIADTLRALAEKPMEGLDELWAYTSGTLRRVLP